MDDKISLVITSISGSNNKVLKHIANKKPKEWSFIMIGDKKSPSDFHLENCDYYSTKDQEKLNYLEYVKICPYNSYSRKNIGYLIAMRNGSSIIVETDDDNIPYDSFFDLRKKKYEVNILRNNSWINIYEFFSDKKIWPRGFPLELINNTNSNIQKKVDFKNCLIQQGLANENPDVDAIYRLTYDLPFNFQEQNYPFFLENSYCPFNTQNTTWFKEVFYLLYLPSFCSFRMTDIWKSFVAQRILWTFDSGVSFHNATVYQERNEHDLLKDFKEEIDGYLLNYKLCQDLNELNLLKGIENIAENLKICYKMLVDKEYIYDQKELELLEAWINDVNNLI